MIRKVERLYRKLINNLKSFMAENEIDGPHDEVFDLQDKLELLKS